MDGSCASARSSAPKYRGPSRSVYYMLPTGMSTESACLTDTCERFGSIRRRIRAETRPGRPPRARLRRKAGFLEKLPDDQYVRIRSLLPGHGSATPQRPTFKPIATSAGGGVRAGQDRSGRHVRHSGFRRVDGVQGDACGAERDCLPPQPQDSAPDRRQARRPDHPEGSTRQLECRPAGASRQHPESRRDQAPGPLRKRFHGGGASRDSKPRLPMGLQPWMRSNDFWATMSATPGTERGNISIELP